MDSSGDDKMALSSSGELCPEQEETGQIEERIRLDRRKLENMLQNGHDETGESAESFFHRIMIQTNTLISWPSRLKIGAKSRKDPQVKIRGLPNNVSSAKEMIRPTSSCREKKMTLKVDISHTDHSLLIGKSGCGHKEIGTRTDTHIHFPDANKTAGHLVEKSNQVSINGNSAASLEHARRLLRERQQFLVVFELSNEVRASLVHRLNLESGAADISCLQFFKEMGERHGAQICCPRREPGHLAVKGNFERDRAVQTLKAALELSGELGKLNGQGTPANACLTVEIEQKYHKSLREHRDQGCQDNMDKKLIKEFGVHITFPEAGKFSNGICQQTGRYSSTVELRGPVLEVFRARQYVVGCLPVELTFEMPYDMTLQFIQERASLENQLAELAVRLRSPRGAIALAHRYSGYHHNPQILQNLGNLDMLSGSPTIVTLVTHESNVGSLYRARCVLLGLSVTAANVPDSALMPGETVPADSWSEMEVVGQMAKQNAANSGVSRVQQLMYQTAAAANYPALHVLPTSALAARNQYLQQQLLQQQQADAMANLQLQQYLAAYYQQQQQLSPVTMLGALTSPMQVAAPAPPLPAPVEPRALTISEPIDQVTYGPGSGQAAVSMTTDCGMQHLSPASSASSVDLASLAVQTGVAQSNNPLDSTLRRSSSSGIESDSSEPNWRAPGAERQRQRLMSQTANAYGFGLAPGDSINCQKLLARKAMAQAQDLSDRPRIPDSRWSGSLFSHSMPTRALRTQTASGNSGLVAEQPAAAISPVCSSPSPPRPDDAAPTSEGPSSPLSTSSPSRRSALMNSCYDSQLVQLQLPQDSAGAENGTYVLTKLLIHAQLDEYADLLSQQEIDLETFLTLTDNDLRELGINTFGHRRKMRMLIDNIKSKWDPVSEVAIDQPEPVLQTE